MHSHEIRQRFIEFFTTCDHKLIKRSSLLPRNDSSLLFINSGMAPLKSYFTGERAPPSSKMTNVQPCIRTNDIDDVGDKHHLTFFEMMGSWSINDYYKEEAIELAYDLLNGMLMIDPKKLYVSVYRGNDGIGIPYDETSYKAWKDLGIPSSRIVELGDEDNFWGPAGDEGPCGPCTEVFIDTGSPGDETSYEATGIFDTNNRYIEIWNAGVFMELYKDKSGKFSRLKQHNVDTGAGLERLTMAINSSDSVYDTDIYSGINNVIEDAMAGTAFLPDNVKAMRVIADHLRAAAFIIGDGILPDKNREGYIPRRLIRRCVSAVHRLGIENFSYKDAIEAVLTQSRRDYPEIYERISSITKTIVDEQAGFSKVLRQGEKALIKTINQHGLSISGSAAFNLTSSHGLPLDILMSMADKRGAQIDVDGYNLSMIAHRDTSRGP